MDELIEYIKNMTNMDAVNSPESKDLTECYLSMNKKYSPIIITKENFHKIPLDLIYNEDSVLTFIDGGQAILFESAGFCAGLIRVAAISYSNNKRAKRTIEEFQIIIKEENEKFIVKTFPKNEFDGMIFDPRDDKLLFGAEKASPSRIIPVIRRFAELKIASKSINPILDGTLEARYPYELGFINVLKNASALSKTCSLTTNTGMGITDCLRSLNDDRWYYAPIVENNSPNHPSEIFFVKLNEKSDYVFRFEHNGTNAQNIISALAKNSTDPVFLGYPYGLVDADHTARVTEEEKNMMQTKMRAKLGKEWDSFSKSLKSMNAHEILDNIKF